MGILEAKKLFGNVTNGDSPEKFHGESTEILRNEHNRSDVIPEVIYSFRRRDVIEEKEWRKLYREVFSHRFFLFVASDRRR